MKEISTIATTQCSTSNAILDALLAKMPNWATIKTKIIAHREVATLCCLSYAILAIEADSFSSAIISATCGISFYIITRKGGKQ